MRSIFSLFILIHFQARNLNFSAEHVSVYVLKPYWSSIVISRTTASRDFLNLFFPSRDWFTLPSVLVLSLLKWNCLGFAFSGFTLRQFKYSLKQVWGYVIYHLNFPHRHLCVILITCREDWSLIEASLHDTALPSFQKFSHS